VVSLYRVLKHPHAQQATVGVTPDLTTTQTNALTEILKTLVPAEPTKTTTVVVSETVPTGDDTGTPPVSLTTSTTRELPSIEQLPDSSVPKM